MIHPTTIIDPSAKIGKNFKAGPFCYVGPHVIVGNDVELKSHVVLEGHTTLGNCNTIYPFATIGHIPQDKKYSGETTYLEIGDDNIIREYVTMQPGTATDNKLTKIGNRGLFMVGTHIAHDCVIGNDVIFANHATLAGHVVVEDNVIIGGLSAVHQFVRIGAHAMIGGMSGVEQDVIPYGIVIGERARLSGLNLVGLKRRGFSQKSISALREAYRTLFTPETAEKASTFQERLSQIKKEKSEIPEIESLINFIQGESHRNLCMPKG
ncbi:acyl-ACP--UDP-N-acetylglucosamine O-acyltransferase [Candidatus Odyssella acanthamoebae]|uniref:Acyl-[acyl-carrier-protein]--UDP-N-acetylglucosamine O-acyltransferase n=1 Tax=Candidatus Odyssella acanthamoebae TaxID=91604 RepID=A0A077ARG7_9PROT|nr:acyl-ACP--UDP-N-acetylglucosamine O-acyltransferase [Candidatus Paracaedibacter acanthamoebae]AIK95797.1 UDP-N-acetylglucosamine acyltransferase [Candidatus Paracaedibacter acanthamoebae]